MSEKKPKEKTIRMWIAVGSSPAMNILGYTKRNVIEAMTVLGLRLTPVRVEFKIPRRIP